MGIRYPKHKTAEATEPALKPNLTRLQIAFEIGSYQMPEAKEWIFDAKIFRASAETQKVKIGNLPGYMASLEGWRHSGFILQPMLNGVAAANTLVVLSAMGERLRMPRTVPLKEQWTIDNVCFREDGRETFGWSAVCEYFSLGMWDAKRIFQGYGSPWPPTMASTLRYLEMFIANRK